MRKSRFLGVSGQRRLSLQAQSPAAGYKKYMCVICGFIYDEAAGRPEDGIAPGTAWEDVPDTWCCPDCGASKDDFEMLEV
jgi:rubredoxin